MFVSCFCFQLRHKLQNNKNDMQKGFGHPKWISAKQQKKTIKEKKIMEIRHFQLAEYSTLNDLDWTWS